MVADDFTTYGKTDTGTGISTPWIEPLKNFKNLFCIFITETDSIIGKNYLCIFFVLLKGKRHGL